ncbi:MAG TPA: ABC transporter permease [Candidatus Limnocylindrales bacterium]|nr:ABC transporter permease [Candidatus Limnocylindrales bacterium]
MSAPASFGRLVSAQAVAEGRLTLRRGENLLAMVILPAAALWFLGSLPGTTRTVASILPSVLALAILASGLVNLAIATGFERGYGVLKRLGGSPLGRDGLLVAKLVVVALIGVAQVILLIALAMAMGFRPGSDVSPAALVAAAVLGSATFSALALLLAGTLRAEATLVVANVLFLASLVLGGVLVPLANLPDALQTVALLSPVGALAELFRCALGFGGSFVQNTAVVAIWGVGGAVLTARYFRWD